MEEQAKGIQAHNFLVLAKHYAHHLPHGDKSCMACEAIRVIEQGQYEAGEVDMAKRFSDDNIGYTDGSPH